MVDYKCINCNKIFNSPSKLERHSNIKTPCNKEKKELKCELCNVTFKRPKEQERHEKTKKHIDNKMVKSNDNKMDKDNEIINYKYEFNKLNQNYNLLLNENKNLTEKLNKLLLENNLLKTNLNKNLEHHEQIYIIHERTFVELNANIYKIGKTKNIKNRLNGYSKGSKLLFSIACKNCTESEKHILNFLKEDKKYMHAKEYGNEYFQCNLDDLISDIYNLIQCQI